MGKGMMIAAWVISLGLLSLLFSGLLERRNNPNTHPTIRHESNLVTLTLRRNPGGHYVAQGQINGHGVTFLVDTGATDVAIPEAMALRMGLRKGVLMTSITANGHADAWSSLIDELRLGPITRYRIRASILPNMPGDQVLLGMSFLRDMELIQRQGQLQIRALARP